MVLDPVRPESAKVKTPIALDHAVVAGDDVRLQGFRTDRLRDLALSLRSGGVGLYRKSDYVHVDTGRVRTWAG